jgi:uncharacterized protein YegP (UPF0339 family)
MPEYYLDNAGEWRWRIKASNGEITDASSEGFDTKAAATHNYALNHVVTRDD